MTWVVGNLPVVNGPFVAGPLGSWRGFSGNGMLAAHGPNSSLISLWEWNGTGFDVIPCPVTPSNDLVMSFRNGPDSGDQVMVRSRSLDRNSVEWNWLRTSGSLGSPLCLEVAGYPLDDVIAWQPLGGGYWLTCRKVDSYYGALEVTLWDMNTAVNIVVQRKRMGRADGGEWSHDMVPLGYHDGLAGFADFLAGEIYWMRVATSVKDAVAPSQAPGMTGTIKEEAL